MAKQQVRISIDRELLREARAYGLDLGGVLELAIEGRVKALKALEGMEDLEVG